LFNRILPLAAVVLISCASPTSPDDLARRTRAEYRTATNVVVSARIGGFNHRANLKPFLLQRAALEASSAGYPVFRIETMSAEFVAEPAGFWLASGDIHYLRAYQPEEPGTTYKVADVLHSQERTKIDHRSLASITGSNFSSDTIAWQNLIPVLLDTVDTDDSSLASFVYGSRVFVRPGVNRIAAFLNFARAPDRVGRQSLVHLTATLRKGHSYRVTGGPFDDGFEVWIEDLANPSERLGVTRFPI
jgi:hypothetical protein